MNLRTTVEAGLVKTVMGLPAKAQRALSGRPLVLDGQTLAPDLQLMLALQKLARKGDLRGADVISGRAAMKANAGLVGGRQPIGAVRELTVAGLPARHYLPHGARAVRAGTPLLLFFHGGGFLYGDLDSHDAPCRVLAEESGVPVLSVEYRVGPEAAFPTAFDDAEAALRWVHDNAAELGVDPARIGVGGDSAGGNIAAWTAIVAAREGLPLAFQLLIYPCVDVDRDTESLRLFGEGLYLTAEGMQEFTESYLLTPEDRADDRMNLLDVKLPDGLAPAYVVTAGFDPLRDEGEEYARLLVDAGVEVELRRFVDQIHGFLNIVGVGRSSRAAVLEIAGRLREGLAARS
ncbi:alpha/beta hydrolase [Nocardioides ginsengisoli]|uniref:Alpha/beta hydrolase n=1 Tax=Nocardioides ginsengisoli TaxID=363868 RepID=A0ABW3W4T3_9ACTN